jgi:hypothetical protein
MIVASAISSTPLQQLIAAGKFKPVIRQIKGDKRWVVRIRLHNGKPVFHCLNTDLTAIPHPTLKDLSDIPILIGLDSAIADNELAYEINTAAFSLTRLSVMSPELKGEQRPVSITSKSKGTATLEINLEGVKVYAVVQ